MADTFEIVIAGAGHNSLVAAAYLAKAGFKCLVLEGRQVIGGDTMTEELTLPYLYRAVTNRCLNLIRDRAGRERLLAHQESALRGPGLQGVEQ